MKTEIEKMATVGKILRLLEIVLWLYIGFCIGLLLFPHIAR